MTIRPFTSTLFTAFLITVLLLSVVTAEDTIMPGLPDMFYGTVEIADGKPVPANYPVEAIGEGVTTGIAGNPLLTHEGGFGGFGAMNSKLIVQGTIQPGDPITFLVGDYPAQVWVVANPQGWQDNISFVSGEVIEVKLKIDAVLTEQEAPADVFVYPTVTQNTASSGSGSVSYGTGTGSSTGSSSPATYVTLTPGQTSPPAGSSVTQIATPAVRGTSAPAQTGEPAGDTTEVPSAQAIPPSYIAGGIIIVIIIAGGAWYYSRMGKKD